MKSRLPEPVRRAAASIFLFASILLEPSPASSGAETQPDPKLAGAWWSAVQHQIASSEYAVTRRAGTAEEPSAWQAPNRAQGFRTYFEPHGIRVSPREGATPWRWTLRLATYGRGDAAVPIDRARLTVEANRVVYDHGSIVEWYANDTRGLEQGFSLSGRPGTRAAAERRAGHTAGPVHLDLLLRGDLSPSVSPDGQSVDFATSDGRRVIHYSELKVQDANGRPQRAWMEEFRQAESRGIRLVFDDAHAVYPVSIDPLATSPAWSAESDQANAQLGLGVATAGDVNGDGFSDVIVGARLFDNGETDEGRAYVYLGSASGIATTPAWTAEGNRTGAQFGFSVATAGDVNGDGYSDVVVGAMGFTNGENQEGAAFLYLGSSQGLSSTPAWAAESNQAGALFGVSVATAGDVNADGFSDVLVGAEMFSNGQTNEGRAFLYLGSAGGLSTTPAWTAEGNSATALFGHCVATAGDVNGDRYADVIIGASQYTNGETFEGRAFVYLGSATGLSTTPVWTAEGNQAVALFGFSVGTAGDVNGDGYADIIVGAQLFDATEGDEGRAFVYHGSPGGPSGGNWIVDGAQNGARFGISVGPAGDVNGDGYSDVIVGASLFDSGAHDQGGAFVFFGSSSGLATDAGWSAAGTQISEGFGRSVGTAGDVNGDGYADVIIGANLFDDGQTDEGKAVVYLGSASGLAGTPGFELTGTQSHAAYGESVATAGDVNGDGYADVVIGEYLYTVCQFCGDQGRVTVHYGSATGLPATPSWTKVGTGSTEYLGSSVSTAGDVNGDGYDDLIVGGQAWANAQPGAGHALVFHGSASGLLANPSWTVEGSVSFGLFGYSVATAGDVNGDGYADVIVGEPGYYDGNQAHGRATVYLGSASGLATTPAWSAVGTQSGGNFGGSVAGAGDVNGDGYSDVIVGAGDDYGGQGLAFVYFGSSAGLSSSPNWTSDGEQAGHSFGFSVASAGDVNGDGYADVLVGAPTAPGPQFQYAGEAFLFLGSAGGPSTKPDWATTGSSFSEYYGFSVATAGDVNGDGTADVVIGAPLFDKGDLEDEGIAVVYYGSKTDGLSKDPGWSFANGEDNAELGTCVATAGDVNGDGYADVLIGDEFYPNASVDLGRVSLFYGNGARGANLLPRQRRFNFAIPLAHLGKTDINDRFRLAALGRSPWGRAPLKLQMEVKPLGTSFDGTGTQQSFFWTDSGIGGATLNQLFVGLTPNTPYHWRLRILYNPATSPFTRASRWLTMPWNGWQEEDFRTRP